MLDLLSPRLNSQNGEPFLISLLIVKVCPICGTGVILEQQNKTAGKNISVKRSQATIKYDKTLVKASNVQTLPTH